MKITLVKKRPKDFYLIFIGIKFCEYAIINLLVKYILKYIEFM